jgi:dTDP-4-dehydro-6-deoxy-alpha-D-glucopyranose 2,3-dehydratase
MENNELYDTPELVRWVGELREKEQMKISRVPLRELRQWSAKSTGEIVHSSGAFYEIVGIRVENADREVPAWDQPLIFQQEMGILGIVRTTHKGVKYYLLQGKAEPGNVELIQISPTLQATFANIKQAHQGKKPLYVEYFEEGAPYAIVYKQWLAEDGGRFLGKTNLNMIVEVQQLIDKPIPTRFRWFTLGQVKELLHHDNLIGPHVRSIMAHL